MARVLRVGLITIEPRARNQRLTGSHAAERGSDARTEQHKGEPRRAHKNAPRLSKALAHAQRRVGGLSFVHASASSAPVNGIISAQRWTPHARLWIENGSKSVDATRDNSFFVEIGRAT